MASRDGSRVALGGSMTRGWSLLLLSLCGCQTCANIPGNPTYEPDVGSDVVVLEAEAKAPCTKCDGACLSDPFCAPEVLADMTIGPAGCLTLTEDRIVFGVGRNYSAPCDCKIFSMPKDRSSPPEVIAEPLRCLDMHWDGNTLVVLTPNELWRMNGDGSNPVRLENGNAYRALFARGNDLFFYEDEVGIHRISRKGGPILQTYPAARGSKALVVSNDTIYWGEETNDRIMRAVLDSDAAADILLSPVEHPKHIALDGEGTLWIASGTGPGLIQRWSADSGAAIVTPLGIPDQVLIAGDDIYINDIDRFSTTLNAGAIYRYRPKTGESLKLVGNVSSPNGLAADDDYLYYTQAVETSPSLHRQLMRMHR